jgi:cytochrome c oxidase subunit 1
MSTAVLTHDAAHQAHAHPEPTGWKKYLWSLDHKTIGLQYLFGSLLFLFIGGGLALLLRWQLAFPSTQVMPDGNVGNPLSLAFINPQFYNALFTMHATVMVFLVVMPVLVGAFGNYLIPLKIGCGDMAFPLINELSFWFWLASGAIMLAGFFVAGGAAAGGWTAYAPLSTVAAYNGTKIGQTLWAAGLFVNGLASIMGAFNYITTIVNMRAPGMGFFRMPLAVWALFITAFLLLLAIPVLSAASAMLILDLNFGTNFFNPAKGGQPLLWQHLFWFFGHPEVYILILPAMGMVSDILSVNSRKPVFGYRAMVYAMIAIGFLGFVVWGHHMFVSGMNLVLSAAFGISTMVIAVPSAIKTFNWLGTIWGGSIRFNTAMLNALAFVAMFVIGGFSGIFMASTPVNIFVHHTYFIVAHFHYVLFGGSIFAMFAGIYFWYPKMFGRLMNETLGKIHFALTFIFFNLCFFPMHNVGLGGMMRRIADPTVYEHLRALQPINQFITISAIALGFSQILFLYNFFRSFWHGEPAGKNPWEGTTLEWTVDSPPGHGNFATTPTVYRGAYEYSVPGHAKDFIMQTEPPEPDLPAGALAKLRPVPVG